MTFARVFGKFDMELDNTTAKDVAIEKIYITGYPRLTSSRKHGAAEVKVKIMRKLEAQEWHQELSKAWKAHDLTLDAHMRRDEVQSSSQLAEQGSG